jgi:hypothetical protein
MNAPTHFEPFQLPSYPKLPLKKCFVDWYQQNFSQPLPLDRIGLSQAAPVGLPNAPVHTNAGLYTLFDTNPQTQPFQEAMFAALASSLQQVGYEWRRALHPGQRLQQTQGWVSDGRMHITLTNFRPNQPFVQAPFRDINWVIQQVQGVGPLRLRLDQVRLTPSMEVIATFFPNQAAETLRERLRQGEFATMTKPDIYHMTIARLAPGFALDHPEDRFKIIQLVDLLERQTDALKTAFPDPLVFNTVAVVHNQFSRGLYGQNPTKPWGFPPQVITLN